MMFVRFMVVLAFIVAMLVRHHHHEPRHPARAQTAMAATQKEERTPVNKEIVQNAERLTETLRRCQQTARQNKEIQ